MENKPDDNIDIDKYTNYTYQSNEPKPASWDSYSYQSQNASAYSAPEQTMPQTGGIYAPPQTENPYPQSETYNVYTQPQTDRAYSQPQTGGGNFNPYAQADPGSKLPQYPQYGQQTTPYSAPVRYTQPGQYEQYVYSGGGYDSQPSAPSAPGKGLSIASMACGIASICTFNFIPGIVALCLSKNFRRTNNGEHNGFSKTGKICGIIGIIVSAIVIFAYVVFFFGFVIPTLFEGLSRVP